MNAFRKRIASLILIAAISTIGVAASPAPQIKSIAFVGMSAPKSVEQLATTYSAAKVKVTYTDKQTKLIPLRYNVLYKTGDTRGGKIFGGVYDVKGQSIFDASGEGKPTPFFSNGPDSNGLIVQNGRINLFTHFEYTMHSNDQKSVYGRLPGSVAYTQLEQNNRNGALRVSKYAPVDFSNWGGLWIPCNGSVSPWNSFLSSEEYEPDARAFQTNPSATYVTPFTKAYYQSSTMKGNPYLYGYIPEVKLDDQNRPTVVKHFSMGRFSHELARVAADNRTVFYGDDGRYTTLFMYVADHAKNLSAGTLYAAKWIQTSSVNGGSANLKWIKLGHASDSELEKIVRAGVRFSDIFATASKPTKGYTVIKTYPSERIEYLKVKPGKAKWAAFLESRRYAAMLGATSEFNKMEGVVFNKQDKQVYIAIQSILGGMTKDTTGTAPADDIQVKAVLSGAVYKLDLKGGQFDHHQQRINSEYVPVTMKAMLVGKDLVKQDALGNRAANDWIASPDNLSYSPALHTLFISEDGGIHANCYVWAYSLSDKKLSRILSVSGGGESTGLQIVDNANGFAYLMSNVQHPGSELIYPSTIKNKVSTLINQDWNNGRSGPVGYISGIPAISP